MKQEKSQLKIGIVLNYANMILGNLIPIFYTPVMLSLLGQSEYGLYKLSSSVTSYLSLISLGIGSAVTRYLIKAREEEGKEAEERFLGLFMVIFQIIAVAALVVGTVLTLSLGIWYGDSLTAAELARMKILVFLMVCNMALSFSQSPYNAVVSAHERFVFQQCINIVTTCVGPLLNIVMLMLGYASIGMTVSTLIIGIVCRLVYTVYVRKGLSVRPVYRNMPTHILRDILTFSFWVFVSNVVGQLYNATDTVMIGALPALGTTAVGIYNIGATFSGIIGSVSTGVSALLAPSVNKMVFQGANDEEQTDYAIKFGRIQSYFAGLFVSGFVAFGLPFIQFYAGEGYEEAYWVAVFMAVPSVIYLSQSVCLSITVARNMHQFRSVVYFVIAVLNVIGTWFMMQIWGVAGAALMTGIATILGHGLMMNWYYNYRVGLSICRFWKSVGVIYLIPASLCVITCIIGSCIDFYRPYAFILGVLVYTIIFCMLNWLFVMNKYEKDMIRKTLLGLWSVVRNTK